MEKQNSLLDHFDEYFRAKCRLNRTIAYISDVVSATFLGLALSYSLTGNSEEAKMSASIALGGLVLRTNSWYENRRLHVQETELRQTTEDIEEFFSKTRSISDADVNLNKKVCEN